MSDFDPVSCVLQDTTPALFESPVSQEELGTDSLHALCEVKVKESSPELEGMAIVLISIEDQKKSRNGQSTPACAGCQPTRLDSRHHLIQGQHGMLPETVVPEESTSKLSVLKLCGRDGRIAQGHGHL